MRITTLAVVAVLFSFTTATNAAASLIYSEDFEGFTPGSINGQGGWTAELSDGLDIATGAGNTVALGDGTNGASRRANTLSLSNVRRVTIEVDMRQTIGSPNFQNIFGIQNSAGDDIFRIGSQSGLGYRLLPDTGPDFFTGNITGDDALTSGHQFFTHRIEYDFLTDTGSWQVSRQAGDGLFSTITTFTSADLGLAILDPANWTGLSLRATSASDQFDNINIFGVVPEPSTGLLLGFGLFGLVMRRKTRSRV